MSWLSFRCRLTAPLWERDVVFARFGGNAPNRVPDVNYVGGSRQLRRRVTPGPPPAMAGGGDSEK
jgi:hypothetical protein